MSLDIWLYAEVDLGGDEPEQLRVGESFNYTHNVSPMWREAGCYEALYKSAGKEAREFLPALRCAIVEMEDHPGKFKRLNPSNGWGDYNSAVDWLRRVAALFARYPKAKIGVSA